MTGPDTPGVIQGTGKLEMVGFREQEMIKAVFKEFIPGFPTPISTTYFLYISGMYEGKRGLDPDGLISYHVDPPRNRTYWQTYLDRRTAK